MAYVGLRSPMRCTLAYLSPWTRFVVYHVPIAVLTVSACWAMPYWLLWFIVVFYVWWQYKSGARGEMLKAVDECTRSYVEDGCDEESAFARANQLIAKQVGTTVPGIAMRGTNYAYMTYLRRQGRMGKQQSPRSARQEER